MHDLGEGYSGRHQGNNQKKREKNMRDTTLRNTCDVPWGFLKPKVLEMLQYQGR